MSRGRSILLISILYLFVGWGLESRAQTPARGIDGYRLVWADEFNSAGPVDTSAWRFEKGFVRNHELQWYQEDNAWCENGCLVIEARRGKKTNPLFQAGSTDWRKSRPEIRYTSSSINTRGKKNWMSGRFEIRARIRTENGLWPAFWTLGVEKEWPQNGEIDIMEYYCDSLLANIAHGTRERFKAKWFTVKKSVASFGDKHWDQKFHTWRMDWDQKEIRLFVDDLLMNRVPLDQLVNPDGFNPFRQPHYILLNLAIGGDNGGDPSLTKFPSRYEIDYVRVYQKK